MATLVRRAAHVPRREPYSALCGASNVPEFLASHSAAFRARYALGVPDLFSVGSGFLDTCRLRAIPKETVSLDIIRLRLSNGLCKIFSNRDCNRY